MARSNQFATPALALFREMGNLASAVFADIADLRRSGQLTEDGPYDMTGLNTSLFDDELTLDCLRAIARSPVFPFDLGEMVNALRRGARFMDGDLGSRQRGHIPPQFSHATRLTVQILSLARKMALTDPTFAKLAFDLSDAEALALINAPEIALVEAATFVRLTFRKELFADVIASYVTFGSQRRKDRHGLLPHMARWSGLALKQ